MPSRSLPEPQKRDAEATRKRILDAAVEAFSTVGYPATGIRDVAALAGTSTTLLLRYFGSKAGLFEAALRHCIPSERIETVTNDDFAQRVTRWISTEAIATKLTMMIVLASGESEIAELAARVYAQTNIAPLAAFFGGADGTERATEVALLSTGYIFLMRHMSLESCDDAQREAITGWYQRTLEEIVKRPASATMAEAK
ncbi:TetR/AcrR family transcriptional regulator [Novosphingobium sp. YJ-S2-02]|uniref:TetR/AcrR family transcriptional regulator n=1 Tax=Novosphingobium aureum TaxID=2792964 RepID=A0A931HAV8_9SPHN|nr:TetR/AcrR family transcriptional regulator [Novosphingobium aureum]MBH0112109.1 TetR/AcrR family transcriptional regulator [Novosphingobium aureum]